VVKIFYINNRCGAEKTLLPFLLICYDIPLKEKDVIGFLGFNIFIKSYKYFERT